MAYDDFIIQDSGEFPFIAGDVLNNVSDSDYRDYVRYGLFFVDHHMCLRFEPTSQIIATSREQFDILIEELMEFRNYTARRVREPDPKRAAELMPPTPDQNKP